MIGPFEEMVERLWERSYSHSAVSNRLDHRRADPEKQRKGAVGARDFKKSAGQRHGQRQKSKKRSKAHERPD